MSNRVCSECEWPVLASLGNCPICGTPHSSNDNSATSNFDRILGTPSPLPTRYASHAAVLVLLAAGGILLPRDYFSTQLALTSWCFMACLVWTLKASLRILDRRILSHLIANAGVFAGLSLLSHLGHQTVSKTVPNPVGQVTTIPTPSAVPLPVEDPELTRLRERGAKTWNYIAEARRILSSERGAAATGQSSYKATPHEQLIEQLESLSTIGVDVDAVELVFELTSALRLVAAQIKKDQDLSGFVEAFLRGLSGDPLGAVIDDFQMRKVIADEINKVNVNYKRVIAVLEARYSMSFSNLEN